MAAVLAEADPAEEAVLHRYGLHLGQLFQITDDLLDVSGTLETMGKKPGQDAVMHKSTYISLLGKDKARNMAEKEAEQAVQIVKNLNRDTKPLQELLYLLLNRTK